MPAVGADSTVTLNNVSWLPAGVAPTTYPILYMQNCGYLQLRGVSGSTVTLRNTGYDGNVPALTVVGTGQKVCMAAPKGTDGAAGASGAPDDAYYVVTQVDAGLSNEVNLGGLAGSGLIKNTILAGVSTLSQAVAGVDYQAADAGLTDLAGVAMAADKAYYTTADNVHAAFDLPAFGRTLVANTTAALARADLGVDKAVGNLIRLRDQKATTTDGGTFTQGAWQTRAITTEVEDTGAHCALAANQFTLSAGTYRIRARAPAYKVGFHCIRLQNITDGATELAGANAESANADATQTDATLEGRFTIAGAKVFEIQHYCQTTQATDGFGRANSFGGVEIYTEVYIERETG